MNVMRIMVVALIYATTHHPVLCATAPLVSCWKRMDSVARMFKLVV